MKTWQRVSVTALATVALGQLTYEAYQYRSRCVPEPEGFGASFGCGLKQGFIQGLYAPGTALMLLAACAALDWR